MTEVRSALSDGEGGLINVRAEFAAVRAEFGAGFAAVREEIRTGDEETRRQMHILHDEVISRIGLLTEDAKRAVAVSRKQHGKPLTRSFRCSAELPRQRATRETSRSRR